MTRTLVTLVRREYWEHRALWIAPLAVAALIVAGAAVGRINFDWSTTPTPEVQRALFGLVLISFDIPLYLTMSVVLWFYASDCLYAERRDRSILFWKSMPVSDAQTVLSKVLVLLLVAPLSVYAVSLVTSLVAAGIWSLRAWGGGAASSGWDTGVWLRVQGIDFVWVMIASLWYAPIMAYVLLISAWARRNISVWVFAPPLALALTEWFTLRTHHVWDVIGYRFNGLWRYTNLSFSLPDRLADNATAHRAADDALRGIDPAAALGNVDLWLGLAVAAALVYAAIRIRHYRDDN